MNFNNRSLFFLFLLFSLVIRLPIFFPTVIDHDESTYILIADELIKGKIPYVDNLDVKPVGIYLIFAIALKIFNSILSIRILSALVIGICAFLMFRIQEILFSYRGVAITTGLIYVVCASLHKWSWSSNTEIFFQAFSLGGLYILLLARKSSDLLTFGLLAGLGFLVKFHIAFDILAFSIFYFFWKGLSCISWLKDMMVAFIGFLFPIVLTWTIYWKMGYLEELKFALFTIPSGYASDFSLGHLINFIGEFYLSFLPFLLLMIIGLWIARHRQWMLRSHWVLFWCWTILSWAAVAVTGKFFFHYYYQLLPPLCLFTMVWFMVQESNFLSGVKKFMMVHAKWLFVVLILMVWMNQYLQVLKKPDVTKMIYHRISDDWNPGDRIYTTDKNILYYLLDTPLPNKYIHTTVLYDKDLIRAYQVDVDRELENIVNQHMDYYVILKDAPPYIQKDIENNFQLIETYPSDVKVYKRI